MTVKTVEDLSFRKQVKQLILNEGHRIMFMPKFHYELNPIEPVWCCAKQCSHIHCI